MLYAVTGYGQVAKSGLDALAFLNIGIGAKQVALGSAATTLSGDPNQIFWNPAGIVNQSSKFGASVSYNNWLLGLNQESGVITYNMGESGTFGVGFTSFGVNNIPADRDLLPANLASLQIDNQTSSTYNYRDMALILSYARQVTDKLTLGLNVKYLNESIDNMSANAFAIDLGSIYNITDFGISGSPGQSRIGYQVLRYLFADSADVLGRHLVPHKLLRCGWWCIGCRRCAAAGPRPVGLYRRRCEPDKGLRCQSWIQVQLLGHEGCRKLAEGTNLDDDRGLLCRCRCKREACKLQFEVRLFLYPDEYSE